MLRNICSSSTQCWFDAYWKRAFEVDFPLGNKDPMDHLALTKSHPQLMTFARRLRALVTGKPYGFNRQKMRVSVFEEINKRIQFNNFIETGTYIGTTTFFLSKIAVRNNAKVYSCEISDEYFKIASGTVGHLSNVNLRQGNSVDLLLELASTVADDINFVYLDAHWYDFLPLREELSILKNWPNSIVMIDDFRVPSDDGFGWDKYDEQRALCFQYIETVIGDKPVFFPAYPASREGLHARGYCVIPMSNVVTSALEEISLLRKHEK